MVKNEVSHITVGKLGEQIASLYIQKKKYKIISTNYRCKSGEVDIIALSPSKALSFIEVKCRVGTRHGMPYESVTIGKQKRMMTAIQLYLLQNKIKDAKLSIEVISIILNPDLSISGIRHFDDLGAGIQELM